MSDAAAHEGDLDLCVNQGLAVTPDDAWSVHSVAHVYEMRADVDKGLKFLGDREKDWAVSGHLDRQQRNFRLASASCCRFLWDSTAC